MRYKGMGGSLDRKEATTFVKKAADCGNVNTMFCFAVMLIKGNFVRRDVDEAYKYLNMASDNDERARSILSGRSYFNNFNLA